MKRSVLKVALSTALMSSVSFGSELILCGNKVKFQKELTISQLMKSNANDSDILLLIHTKDILLEKDKDFLFVNGAKEISYAGVNSYYILLDKNYIDALVEVSDKIDGISVVEPRYKIEDELKNINVSEEIKIKISLVTYMTEKSFIKLLEKNGIDYYDLKFDENFNMAELTIIGMDIEKIASLSIVKEIEKYHKVGLIKPFSNELNVTDIYTARDTQTTQVWRNDTDLDGANIPVAMVDEGKVLRTHQEFMLGNATRIRDRVINGSPSSHSTHVAGIIGAYGINSDARGMANGTQIYSFTFNDRYFANSISYLLNFNIYLSNHSYGFNDEVGLGVYNSDARNEDNVIYNNPCIAMFIAAGNDRTRSGYPNIGIIKGAANAKNVFTIGALKDDSKDVAYYSSSGPTLDGRIKPELSIRGSSIYSTSNGSESDYIYMSGTSMAAPSATGIAALIMQEYKNLTNCGNNRGCNMRSDVLKAVLINTAVDKNNPGPDVYTGYGMINAQGAIELVKTLDHQDQYNGKQKIKLDSINRGDFKIYDFTTTQTKDFKATLCWVDPAGNSSSSGKMLVNDLDIYLLNLDSSKKYYPYSLDRNNPTANALNDRPNEVDNSEKIEVKGLPAGNYRLVVDAHKIQTLTQDYAIATSELIFLKANSIINNTPRTKLKVNNFAKIMLESIYY